MDGVMSDHHESAVSVVLWWIPVGAGGHVVVHTCRWWELVQARLARRAPQQLFHAALEVTVDDGRFVIEMTPAWGDVRGLDRGVVRTGPVGMGLLGRSRLFRYEVRCWRDGIIPDRQWAVGGPTLLTHNAAVARALLDQVREVPARTWGRAVEATGDMWNSNSLISWLLATTGIDTLDLRPPPGGRAPGWDAGLTVAEDLHMASAGEPATADRSQTNDPLLQTRIRAHRRAVQR